MPLLFHCPHCGHETWVSEEILGQNGPCAKCKTTVTVEVNSPHTETPLPASITDGAPIVKLQRFGNQAGQLLPLVGWLAAGLAGVAGMVLIGWLIFRQLAPSPLIAGAQAAKQAERDDHFRRLAAALQTYHNDKGHFPPAYIADQQGTPLHSWRVLLLPYLGHHKLYRKFDLAQPWDSPENIALVNEIPEVYDCPFDDDGVSGETSYLAIAGSGLAFDGTQHRGLSHITDTLSETILLIETCNTGIVWTRPQDLDGQQLIWSAHAQPGGIGCEARDGTLLVATADGRAYRLTDRIPPERLRALATVGGGELESLDGWVVEEISRAPNGP